MSITENLAAAKTELANFVNSITPQIQERLKAGYRLKKAGSFFKKDEDIKAMVSEAVAHHPLVTRAYFDSKNSRLSLHATARYRTGEYSANYVEAYIFLHDLDSGDFYPFEPLETVTAEDLENAQAELAKLDTQRREIEYEISRLKHLLNK